jgi:hypothetical protein
MVTLPPVVRSGKGVAATLRTLTATIPVNVRRVTRTRSTWTATIAVEVERVPVDG